MEQTPDYLCPECWADLPLYRAGPRLRISADFSVFVAFAYNRLVRDLIHTLKFYGRNDFAPRLGYQAGIQLAEHLPDFTDAVIVPVPLHPVRVRERGYDQNLMLASGFSAALKLPVRNDIIYRCRNTYSQSQLSVKERKTNLKDAFKPHKKQNQPLPEGPVILLDDVVHSGSTLQGCFKAMHQIGLKNLTAVAICG